MLWIRYWGPVLLVALFARVAYADEDGLQSLPKLLELPVHPVTLSPVGKHHISYHSSAKVHHVHK